MFFSWIFAYFSCPISPKFNYFGSFWIFGCKIAHQIIGPTNQFWRIEKGKVNFGGKLNLSWMEGGGREYSRLHSRGLFGGREGRKEGTGSLSKYGGGETVFGAVLCLCPPLIIKEGREAGHFHPIPFFRPGCQFSDPFHPNARPQPAASLGMPSMGSCPPKGPQIVPPKAPPFEVISQAQNADDDALLLPFLHPKSLYSFLPAAFFLSLPFFCHSTHFMPAWFSIPSIRPSGGPPPLNSRPSFQFHYQRVNECFWWVGIAFRRCWICWSHWSGLDQKRGIGTNWARIDGEKILNEMRARMKMAEMGRGKGDWLISQNEWEKVLGGKANSIRNEVFVTAKCGKGNGGII